MVHCGIKVPRIKTPKKLDIGGARKKVRASELPFQADPVNFCQVVSDPLKETWP